MEAGRLIEAADIHRGSTATTFDRGRDEYWIAPSIGEMARMIVVIVPPYFQNISRVEWHLLSYQLR